MSQDERDEPPLPESIWETLRRDEPEPRAVQAAYLRFLTRRPERVSALLLLRWLAAGFVAGWGVAFAATGDPLFGAGLRNKPQVEVRAADTSPAVHAPARSRAPELASSSDTPPSAPDAPVAEPSSAVQRATPGLHDEFAPPTSADPKWQRTAAALKAHDYDVAEGALRELETGGAPGDRDAASLALAQVLLTRGRTVEARARLERLRLHAGSALVREKARALLEDPHSAVERSSAAPAVTQ